MRAIHRTSGGNSGIAGYAYGSGNGNGNTGGGVLGGAQSREDAVKVLQERVNREVLTVTEYAKGRGGCRREYVNM